MELPHCSTSLLLTKCHYFLCLSFLVSKKLQEIKDEIARVDNEIAKLNEEITFAQKRIVSLKFGSKDEQLYCKDLNANVNDLSSKAKQQQAKRLQVKYK